MTTAGRTLDVTAGGEAGIDWANVGSPTTSLNLSGTTISTSQAVASVSGAVGSVTGNVGGNVTGSVGSLGAQAKLDVNAEADTALADYDAPTKAELDSGLSSLQTHGDSTWSTATGFSTHSASDVWSVVTRTITGGTISTVSDKTGYALTQAFPSNFAALGINSSGHVSRVTLVDTTTTNSDMRGTDSAYTGTPPSAGSIADAVWDEAQAGHTTSGTFGAYVDASISGVSTGGVSAGDIASAVRTELATELGRIDAAVSSRSSHSAADVWSVVTRTITGGTISTVSDKTGYSLSQAFPTNFAALGINSSGHVSRVTLVDTTTTNSDMRGTDSAYTGTPPSASAIADAVWDEVQSGHSTPGSYGVYLDEAISGASTGGVSANDIASAVRTELSTELGRIDVAVSSRSSHSASDVISSMGTGTFLTGIPWNSAWDAEVQSECADAIASDASISGIKSKTDNLPVDPADASDISSAFSTVNGTLSTIAGYIDTEVAAVKVVTDRISGMLEQDGPVHRFTVNALEQAPGGGGSGNVTWTSDEQDAIYEKVMLIGTAEISGESLTSISNTILTGLSGVNPQVVSRYNPRTRRISLVQNDDYNSSDGTQVDIPVSLPVGIAAADCSAKFSAANVNDTAERLDLTGLSLVTIAGKAYVRFVATASDMAISDGTYDYQLIVVKSGRRVTVVEGILDVVKAIVPTS